MRRKDKLFFVIIGIVFAWLTGMVIWSYSPMIKDDIEIKIELEADISDECKLYYTTDGIGGVESFSEDLHVTDELNKNENQVLVYSVPYNVTHIRFDLGEQSSNATIYNIDLCHKENTLTYDMKDAIDVHVFNNITAYFLNDEGYIELTTDGTDPYVVWDITEYDLQSIMRESYADYLVVFKIILSGLAVVVFFLAWKKRNLWGGIPKDLYANKAMIWSLAKTDFKTKYSASNFGVVWAFVQPVVTIAIYVFVFQIGFKAGDTSTGYPFLLYLVSGIIPWFFFAESWMNATNCLIEYNYLVKKVVFKISVLPIVKVIASLFVHLAFIGLALIVFIFSGRIPGVQVVQIIYYLICTFALVLSLSYFTAAIIPFFRDLAQIINIITQLGMWTLPIMYDEAIIGEGIMRFLRFNPMYYVVTGYRDAFMNGQWFWERTGQTVYFWIIVLVLFTIGFRTFKKLKVHFADVL